MQIQYLTSTDLAGLTEPIVADGVLVVIPFTQYELAQKAAQLMAARAEAPGLILGIDDSKKVGFIHLVNQVFTQSHSAYFAYTAQDAFAGRGWLNLGLKAMGDHSGFLGFNDGKWAGALAGFGLARRSWAMKNYDGQFFYPQYHRHFADAELTLLALQDKQYAYDPNSVLVEVDWNKDTAPIHQADRNLFLERRKSGFDGRVLDPRLLNLIS